MLAPETLPSGGQITKDVGLYSKVLLPALAALVPAAMGAAFKWVQDHSRSRQRVTLTERMAALSKLISEVPDVAVEAGTVVTSPRAVLMVELASVTRELGALQLQVGKHVVSSATGRVRAALLLYRPHGFFAWVLHGIFYLYLMGYSMGLTAVLAKPHDPEFWYGILGFGVLGIPPVVVGYMASRLHRAYCAKQAALAGTSGGAQAPASFSGAVGAAGT